MVDPSLERPMDRAPDHPMRQFASGAIRDTNTDKLDYKGFTSEAADRRFAEYMHKHRKQANGTLRGSDNWKLGIPTSAYEESLYRHFKEFFQTLEANKYGPVDKTEQAMEIAQAIRFNLQGWVHEMLKTQALKSQTQSATLGGKEAVKEALIKLDLEPRNFMKE